MIFPVGGDCQNCSHFFPIRVSLFHRDPCGWIINRAPPAGIQNRSIIPSAQKFSNSGCVIIIHHKQAVPFIEPHLKVEGLHCDRLAGVLRWSHHVKLWICFCTLKVFSYAVFVHQGQLTDSYADRCTYRRMQCSDSSDRVLSQKCVCLCLPTCVGVCMCVSWSTGGWSFVTLHSRLVDDK